MQDDNWRSIRRWHLFGLLAPITLGSLLGVVEWFGYGSLSSDFLLGIGAVIAFGVMMLSALSMPFVRRSGGHATLWGAIALVACMVGIRLQGIGRVWGLASCAENAKPLIAAIDKYLADHGQAPVGLSDLVPVYLDHIPGTGLFRYPKWDYGMANGEPYELLVNCSLFLSFDSFVYWPSGNYPQHLYGGSVERIGVWAYVHE